jgi:hypothetical protein
MIICHRTFRSQEVCANLRDNGSTNNSFRHELTENDGDPGQMHIDGKMARYGKTLQMFHCKQQNKMGLHSFVGQVASTNGHLLMWMPSSKTGMGLPVLMNFPSEQVGDACLLRFELLVLIRVIEFPCCFSIINLSVGFDGFLILMPVVRHASSESNLQLNNHFW